MRKRILNFDLKEWCMKTEFFFILSFDFLNEKHNAWFSNKIFFLFYLLISKKSSKTNSFFNLHIYIPLWQLLAIGLFNPFMGSNKRDANKIKGFDKIDIRKTYCASSLKRQRKSSGGHFEKLVLKLEKRDMLVRSRPKQPVALPLG